MSLASAGITPDVIREMMPPYHLSDDLLAGTCTALPPPPAGAPASWRHARLSRLVQEIAGFMPADAPQARLAAQIVVIREVTDDTFARSHAPELTVEQVCRLRRTAADLTRTAATLERAVARRQAKPAPFFGTVLAEGVDIAALDALWCQDPRDERPEAGPRDDGEGAGPMERRDGDAPGGRGDLTDGPVPLGMAGATPGTSARGQGLPAMTTGESGDGPAATIAASCDNPVATEAENADSPAMPVGRQAPAGLGRDAGSPLGSVVTRLDQGLGWTLDVVRPGMGGKAGIGPAPESVA